MDLLHDASMTTFAERGIGDVLLTWENEALVSKKALGNKFDIVYPSMSILTEPSVAIVDKTVEK
jgi:sulfate transport system substrate-binding protein